LITGRAADSATATKEPPARRPRVLVVDDEALTAYEVTKLLKDAGFDLIGPAASVTQAFRLLEEQLGCDAAVLDVNLGRETSELVARRLASSGTPFLTITGYARLQLRLAFKAAPAFDQARFPLVGTLPASTSACSAVCPGRTFSVVFDQAR
jgi:CheY-like chemotaxis protein